MNKYRMMLAALLAGVISIGAPAQKIGDKGYRQARRVWNEIRQVVPSPFGGVTDGKTITKVPEGTIMECRCAGKGIWVAKLDSAGHEGILHNWEDRTAEEVNPLLLAGKTFTYEVYAEAASSFDAPILVAHMKPSKKVSLIDNLGNMVLDIIKIEYPGTSKEKTEKYKYCGTYMPYYISLTHEWKDDKAVPINEIRVYPQIGKPFVDEGLMATGAYCNGILYQNHTPGR